MQRDQQVHQPCPATWQPCLDCFLRFAPWPSRLCPLPPAFSLQHPPAVFPNIPAPGGDNGPTFSECARKHLAAKPRKGSAVLFHSIKPSGEMERRSLHTACPVIRGEKWSAPKVGGRGPAAASQQALSALRQSCGAAS